jgi:hypothetical protein
VRESSTCKRGSWNTKIKRTYIRECKCDELKSSRARHNLFGERSLRFVQISGRALVYKQSGIERMIIIPPSERANELRHSGNLTYRYVDTRLRNGVVREPERHGCFCSRVKRRSGKFRTTTHARFPFLPSDLPSGTANDLKTTKIYGGFAYHCGRMPPRAQSPGR